MLAIIFYHTLFYITFLLSGNNEAECLLGPPCLRAKHAYTETNYGSVLFCFAWQIAYMLYM